MLPQHLFPCIGGDRPWLSSELPLTLLCPFHPSSSQLRFSRAQNLDNIKLPPNPARSPNKTRAPTVSAAPPGGRGRVVYLWPFRMPTYCTCQNPCQVFVHVESGCQMGISPGAWCTMPPSYCVCQTIYILSFRRLPWSVWGPGL